MTQAGTEAFLNRELSWLEFNNRVLEEARDAKNPLLERVRFFCIFHSNLDEFFMVRVASLFRRVEEDDREPDPAGMTPARQLEAVLARARELRQASSALYRQKLIPSLAKEGIRILRPSEVSAAQNEYLDEYFDREVYPVLTPVAVDQSHPLPRLSGLALNLAVLLESAGQPELLLAIVQVPAGLPGLCRLPATGSFDYCWLGDIIRGRLSRLFSGFRVRNVAGFRLTRDAELEFDDEGQDDYVRMLETGLLKRRRGRSIRLEYEEEMAPELLQRLSGAYEVDGPAAMPVRGPLEPRPLQTLVDLQGFDQLRFQPQQPRQPICFTPDRGIFETIRERDVLLHHPYDSFDPVIQFISAAADDPQVLAIKQTLYRTSGEHSPILEALARAAERGKHVTVLLELMARFDEERNIGWARDLEEAGAHVLYGLSGLKTHAKIALVVRREPDGIRRYVHLGTGNYNERTARAYTDLGLLTADEDFGLDASGFFNTITGYSEPPEFRRLVMAPNGLRERIIALIRREADRAKSGQASGILGKMNSLVDRHIVSELYAASAAGVRIRLNVRGICCLRPGIPGVSENVRVVSIVDRYLEHSRAVAFVNGGDTEVWVSSADWMPRNLDRRVELMFPIRDEIARARLVSDLEAQFADNQKARVLNADGSYGRVTQGRGDAVRVQEHLYRRLAEEQERAKATAPVRFIPLETGRE